MSEIPTFPPFSFGTAQQWQTWLEDYCVYGRLKKWNAEKLATNLRFFVSGEVKDCVRQASATSAPVTLDSVSDEVVKLLGGTPDPLIATRQLEAVCYNGNVGRTLLALGELIPLAYPTIMDKIQRDQMTWIHLQRLLPAVYQRDLIKDGVDNLETAVERIRAFERADRSVRPDSLGLYRAQSSPANSSAPREPASRPVTCYVCGLTGHTRNVCSFRSDISGRCETRGHLSTVCRRPAVQLRGRGRLRGRPGNGRQSVPRGLRQTATSSATVAPLSWPNVGALTDRPLIPTGQPQQQQQPLQQPPPQWMPPPPHLELPRRPEPLPTQQPLPPPQQQQ